MSGFSLKFLQDVNRMMNERWGGMDNVATPQGNIPTNREDEFYREAGDSMNLIYAPTRKPVRNKKEFVEEIANKYNLEYREVYAEITELERKYGKQYDIDILRDELKKLEGGH